MNMPNICPSCRGKVLVAELCCPDCKTAVKGSFALPFFAALTPEQENFLKVFLRSRGNIKAVERQLGISYPTVKGKLDSLLNILGLGGLQAKESGRRLEIVKMLERGEITAQEAVRKLEASGETDPEIV